MTNFAGELAAAAAEVPDKPAVKLDDVVVTYGVEEAVTQRIAGFLRSRGVEPGDRVGLQMPNVPYFPFIYFGVLRAGAVLVPMNPLLQGREVAYHLSDSGAKVLFAWHGFAEAAEEGCRDAGTECVLVEPGEFEQTVGAADPVEEIVDRADDDPAVIIYTSGTTGTPKGATLVHSNLAEGARVGRDLVDMKADGVGLATLPLFHVFGMNSVMNVCLVARGLLTLLPRFEPGKALEIIERDGVSSFAGVPTMYTALLHHPEREQHDVSSIDLCVAGGSALPVDVLHGFDEAFGATVLEGYGLTETTGMASFNLPDRERKPGTIGLPVGGTEMKVVGDDDEDLPAGEPGEIVMRGPFVMQGYWNDAAATDEAMRDGWFHTGDVAVVDEDGYFSIVDRKKDLIIRGGYNVYPRELEELLYEHPAVLEAAVVGVPHESLGEEVGAVVVLREGASASEDEVREYMKQRVAAYKYPRVVWFAEVLPKGPTGKILKREIEPPGRTSGS